ncbi:MAG: GTP 3',8-cyclase MoaA [Anaerolineae bacterium]|nr:GTP 3',8-cyclase MoaA [Anaerolineae bacterium]
MRDLRISVTDRCNFRCTYCMPAEVFGERYEFLHHNELLRFEELTRLASIFSGLGVSKLRITGGEPLMRKQLEKLIVLLRQVPGVEDIAMTTNAYFLPGKAAALRAAGLDRITVSLDSLDPAVFHAMNGTKGTVEDVLKGIAAAQAAGFGPIKINTVVKRGVNDHTLVEMARYCREHGHILRFIEFMDVGTRNGWSMEHVVPAQEIMARIDAAFPLEPLPNNYYGETALRYRYQDGAGEIGIIASVTQPFCGSCTRMRISAQGMIYTCLFAAQGVSLRDPLRAGASDGELEQLITRTWGLRVDRYSEERTEEATAARDRIEMYYIGG